MNIRRTVREPQRRLKRKPIGITDHRYFYINKRLQINVMMNINIAEFLLVFAFVLASLALCQFMKFAVEIEPVLRKTQSIVGVPNSERRSHIRAPYPKRLDLREIPLIHWIAR